MNYLSIYNMKQLIKYFSLSILFLLFLQLNSCTKKNDAQKENSQANETDTKVYQLVSCEKSNGNFAANFIWNENGKPVSFAEFTKGKYVLLNFWATWCPPCREEIPDLVQVAKEMESDGLVVIGIALERQSQSKEALKGLTEYWNKNQMYYNVIMGSQEITEAYGGIQSIPATFLINNKGEIVKSFVGALSKEDFIKEIRKMMQG
jgi:thiol-disulfide isomerase/thioredoxin